VYHVDKHNRRRAVGLWLKGIAECVADPDLPVGTYVLLHETYNAEVN